MKRIACAVAIVFWMGCGWAQTNGAIRLAIVAEAPDVLSAADLLTAEFSKGGRVEMVERAEIDRVYREQGLSAGNGDYLKLGQVLGADGLLVMERGRQMTNALPKLPMMGATPLELQVRLLAVKPGVVLADETFTVPWEKLSDWATIYTRHLTPLLPKLGVLAKDAVPISVVNFRLATASAEAAGIEYELKALAIQCLSREPRLFVLERQRMELMTGEKDLQGDVTKFWDGRYVLEGAVDPGGYVKETVVIRGRLTPPNGGEPLQFEVSGARTNLAEVVSRLAAKVAERMQINSRAPEWDPAKEAEQYFDEAQWALRWEIYPEAQTAAESAWALGKRDLACAIARTRAYASDVPKLAPDNVVYYRNRKVANFVHASDLPKEEHCDEALRGLECYYEFSRMAGDDAKVWGDWHKSDWYNAGLETLTVSSDVLRHFYCHPENQKAVAGKLADIRALSRSVAELIVRTPSVHASYWVGDRAVSEDALNRDFSSTADRRFRLNSQPSAAPNIFEFTLRRGSLWQERPQDTVALYRELMASPLFFRIHTALWFREANCPRLVGWNAAQQAEIPGIWHDFVAELDGSTNGFYQFEGQALGCADAKTAAWEGKEPTLESSAAAADADSGWKSSRAALANFVATHYASIVGNNGILPNSDWELYLLLGEKSEYASQLAAVQQAFREKLSQQLKEEEERATIEKQKEYLKNLTPYDFAKFNSVFRQLDYTRAEAMEIQPLLAAYKSNLLAQAPATASAAQKFKVQNDVRCVEFFLERPVTEALNAPARTPVKAPQPAAAAPVTPAPVTPVPAPSELVEQANTNVVTKVLSVTTFLPITLDGPTNEPITRITITAHHWVEGKLLLDLQCMATVYSTNEELKTATTRTKMFPAIAVLDPVSERWRTIRCPEISFVSQSGFYHHTTLCGGKFFTLEGGKLAKFDLTDSRWEVLELPDIGNGELFTVNGRLYVATPELIAEILDDGRRTRILASNRRQPPVSVLDTEDLGTPVLFAGADQTLRAALRKSVVVWDGTDWHKLCAAPSTPLPPLISDGDILFRSLGEGFPGGIWRLEAAGHQLEYLLKQDFGNRTGDASSSNPKWTLSPRFSGLMLPFASHGGELYLLADHGRAERIVDEKRHVTIGQRVLPQNGYHAELFCFSGDFPAPQTVYLRFDGDDDTLPVGGGHSASAFMMPALPSGWFCFGSNCLYFGREVSGALPISGSAAKVARPKVGVWKMPMSAVESVIGVEKKEQQEEQRQIHAAAARATSDLLAKYDVNRDGKIDAAEREAGLGDDRFIEMHWEEIDTNHNGWIDAAELAWFDGNGNKTLESAEQAALAKAPRIFAQQLVKRFDTMGSGWLRRQDYDSLISSTLHVNPNTQFELQFVHADENHDGRVDVGELADLVMRHIQGQLRQGNRHAVGFDRGPVGGGGMARDAGQRFRPAVELYWQSSAPGTKGAPTTNMTAP